MTTCGRLAIHSVPNALCANVEWAVGRALGRPLAWRWHSQPLVPGTMCAQVDWQGPVGSAAAMSSALLGWANIRFDVTEVGTSEQDGSRFSYTPRLGLFRVHVDAAGSSLVPETRLAPLLTADVGIDEIRETLHALLGTLWDEELEPFRAEQLDRVPTLQPVV